MPDETVKPLPLPLKAVGGEIFGKGNFLVANVTAGPGGTSIGSERDRCKQRALAIVAACNAYPGLVARVAALEAENAKLRELLEAVCRNDKTPAYKYGEKNALGHPPRQPGQRWNTPAEMARAALAPKEPQ